jgi:hypothetical protein
MNVTPSMKGSFLPAIGLWLMLWLSLFKLDEIVGDTRMKRWVSTNRCLDWIAHHRSTTLLGTESLQLRVSWDFRSQLGGVRCRRDADESVVRLPRTPCSSALQSKVVRAKPQKSTDHNLIETEPKLAGAQYSRTSTQGDTSMAMYLNHYVHCRTLWDDEWECMCNDRCPVCNCEVEPFASDELNENGMVIGEISHVPENWAPEQGWPEEADNE